jgi:outer membrane protein assembly factor BamB
MLVSDGLLYTVDGPLVDAPVAQPTNDLNRGFNFQNVPRRTRTNFLSAYDAENGKFKWIRSPDGSENGGKFDLGFMAAPVPYAKFLLVPVSDSGAIWLYALEKATGHLVWKTFLCEDPVGGANPWSSVGLAVGGGDAYVATGGGVIFAVDAMSGSVRWAVRYQRSGKENTNLARFGIAAQALMDVTGFEDDVVIPHGRALIVLASDANKMFALDRRSGELIWESPRQPLGEDDPSIYCLGVLGDGLFVAGKKALRRYDLSKDGKMVWEARFDTSYGHGVLTSDAIYVPVGDTVSRFDPITGKLQAQVGMFTATKEPVGNLFSDGARLLAMGLARAYALQDLESRIAMLGERIAAGDSDAQLQRMQLRLRGNKHEEALADLRAACDLILKQQGAASASRTLYSGMGELALVDRDPRLTLSLIVDAQSHIAAEQSAAKISPDELQQVQAQRDNVLFQAFRVIKQQAKPATAEILAATALVDKPNLVNAARQALVATAAQTDAELLRAAIGNENPRTRVVAAAALSKSLGDDAPAILATLLDDANDEVKLTAATALADRGDRRALNSFGKLLDSEDLQVRSRSVAALRALTGQKIKYLAYEKADDRMAGAEEWRRWISANGETAELKFPIGDSQVMLGRTLVAYYSQNKVVEYDADRKKVWELNNVNQPWGADGLPNGHRLICSYNGQFVAEYDESGKEVWRKDGLPGYASHAHRLEDGNTLVSCSNVNKVVEISPDGKTVWEQTINGYPQDARRLDNGNTLIALQTTNRVVEIDRSGKVIWEVTENMQGPFAARRLDNGNTLVALSGAGQVVEIDQNKKVVWRQQGLSSPYDAQRLDNGNTLIVDTRGMREVDPDGNTVWEHNEGGALRVHRY